MGTSVRTSRNTGWVGFFEGLMSSPHLLWNTAKKMGRPGSLAGHGSIFGRLMSSPHLPRNEEKKMLRPGASVGRGSIKNKSSVTPVTMGVKNFNMVIYR
jgi:hypothetical protein